MVFDVRVGGITVDLLESVVIRRNGVHHPEEKEVKDGHTSTQNIQA